MLHPRVGGAYYQIGFREGSFFRRRGLNVPTPSKERAEFARGSESEIGRIFPELLDEMAGFADGCQASKEDTMAFVLGNATFGIGTTACSVFAAVNGPDVVIGRNHDTLYKFRQHLMAYLTCPEGGYRSIGHSDLYTGREGGLNEMGLAVGMAAVEEREIKPGMNLAHAVRYVLDKCGGVDEAIGALSDMRHTTANNFLLVDKKGNMAVVEAAPGRVRTREPEERKGFIVCTNHFLHPDMLDRENREKRCWDSEVRYNAIHAALEGRKGKVSVEDAQAILSDHSGHVCFHDKDGGLGTLWSVVAVPARSRVYRAEGHPCRNKYREDFRLERAIGLR